MQHLKTSLLILAFALLALPGRAAEPVAELIMVDQAGCVYCERWESELAAIYPKTPEGQFAPLRRLDISKIRGSDITFARAVNFTPTFVLIKENTEIARIEGYPGEDFFWGLLDMMLRANTAYQ